MKQSLVLKLVKILLKWPDISPARIAEIIKASTEEVEGEIRTLMNRGHLSQVYRVEGTQVGLPVFAEINLQFNSGVSSGASAGQTIYRMVIADRLFHDSVIITEVLQIVGSSKVDVRMVVSASGQQTIEDLLTFLSHRPQIRRAWACYPKPIRIY